jgi:hypothetical protein
MPDRVASDGLQEAAGNRRPVKTKHLDHHWKSCPGSETKYSTRKLSLSERRGRVPEGMFY